MGGIWAALESRSAHDTGSGSSTYYTSQIGDSYRTDLFAPSSAYGAAGFEPQRPGTRQTAAWTRHKFTSIRQERLWCRDGATAGLFARICTGAASAPRTR